MHLLRLPDGSRLIAPRGHDLHGVARDRLARAVMIGRPILWGLAVAGEAGVARVLTLLRNELDLAMALAGTPTLADITLDLIA